jgi:trehalose utilization protein
MNGNAAEQQGTDGLIGLVGRGKAFYFRPGHETSPIYSQPEGQRMSSPIVGSVSVWC